jgi:hypothetical protein
MSTVTVPEFSSFSFQTGCLRFIWLRRDEKEDRWPNTREHPSVGQTKWNRQSCK